MSDARQALLAAMRATAAPAPRAVQVEGWGTVHVRALTVAEVEDQQGDTADAADKHRIARGAARLMCDAQGSRLFDPANADDVALLAAQPWQLLRQVLAAADTFNGGGTAGEAEAKNG